MSEKDAHTTLTQHPDHPLFGTMESYVLGYNVERLRKGAGMNITTLSRVAGITRPTIYKIEKGESNLKLSFLRKLADALDVTIVDLLSAPQTNARTRFTEWLQNLK